MQAYGSTRLTADLDVLADRVPDDVEPTTTRTFGGVRAPAPNGVPIDWIVRTDRWSRLYERALAAAIPTTAGYSLVSPEWMIVLKMVARRGKDELDVASLILAGQLDIDDARELVRRELGEYAVDDFNAYVLEAEMMKQRGETP